MIESQHFIEMYLTGASSAAVFAALFFGTFVSEDAACIVAGGLAASGAVSLPLAMSACFLGIFAGDVGLYWIGRITGPQVLESGIIRRYVKPATVAKASAWLEQRGGSAVFLSRFVTGLRLPTYLLAGALRTDFSKFALLFLLAAAIWTPVLVGTAAYAGTMWFSENLLIGGIGSFIAIRLIFRYSSWKHRRLLIGRIKRIVNWEFWPIQAFYAPVVVHIILLGIRFRSFTLFTCANPVIPAGGFRGESKDEIYQGLRKSMAAQGHMLEHILIGSAENAEARLARATRFIEAYELKFPVAVKPDQGERGAGVSLAKNAAELDKSLSVAAGDTIVQEFAPGVEVSIFYYRHPGTAKGKIFSVTEKRFPHVTGDGKSTLEELILRDRRAVCMARRYFARNASELAGVVPRGRSIKLLDTGTHSQGAIFLDGAHLITEPLENRIDTICRGFRGFYFGRFDIRAASLEDLQRGENFKIIELNGVTSESTNIYDPEYSIFEAYRILFRQWRIAFEIGSSNRKLGARPTALGELLRLAFPSHRGLVRKRTAANNGMIAAGN